MAIALIVVGLIAVLALGVGVAIFTIDLRSFAEQRLSNALDRRVRIGALRIEWGNPLKVELRDLQLANAPWGSTPNMIEVERVSAEIDAKALLSRQLRYRKLVIVKPIVVLERNPDGVGNWRFGAAPTKPQISQDTKTNGTGKTSGAGGFAIVPKDRRQFPVLLDFALQGGKISYRTYSGHVLRIDLDQVTINAAGDDQLVDVNASGAYNGAKMALTAQTQSFHILRDDPGPFGLTFSLQRQSAKVQFSGTMMEPLDFEGVQGPVKISTDKLSDILSIFGAKISADPAFQVTGDLTRQGNLWNLTDAKGKLAENALTGQLTLLEGKRGQPDDIKVEMNFAQLDLGSLLSAGSDAQKKPSGGANDWMTLPLQPPDKSAPQLAAKLAAQQVKYGDQTLQDVSLNGKLGPGNMTIEPSALTVAGVQIRFSGALKPVSNGGQLTAQIMLDDADAASLANLLGGTPADLSGKLDGGVTLDLRGATIRDGLKASTGGAVLSMTKGQVSRDLLEKAATDLRSIFRKGKGTARISCLLAVMRLRNGLGTLERLRLRTPETTLNGEGTVNFLGQSLDLTLQSEAKSTGFLALDIPLRISGKWRQPSIKMLGKSVQPKPALGAVDDLSPVLRQIAVANSCSQ